MINKTVISFSGAEKDEKTFEGSESRASLIHLISEINSIPPTPESILRKEISETRLVALPTPEPQNTLLNTDQTPMSDSFWDSLENKKTNSSSKFDLVWIGIMLATILLVFGGIIYNNRAPTPQVLSATQDKTAINEKAYADWAIEKFGKIVPQIEDEDQDQLTNKEEFIIGSDPKKFSTCNTTKSDAETLYELVDPKTCKPVEISDEEVITRLSKVIDLQKLNKELASKNTQSSSSSIDTIITSLLSETGVLSRDQIDSAQNKLDQQKQYAQLLTKIDSYTQQYRSYGQLDRNYPTPVESTVFLRISLKYKVPMKYIMAVARLESRFGTDRFTDSGAETRVGTFRNMYSLGLDDSGNNLNYATWEDGVEGFGRWYRNFDDKGVSDCAKWRIYNPNGDYCSKVETTATDFENFVVKN